MTGAEAVARARTALGTGTYLLGGTDQCDKSGWRTDCSGFVCWAWSIRRDRPEGFNRGPWSTVADAVNTDSMVQDAQHKQELFTAVPAALAEPGDLLVYPGAWQAGHRILIGHVSLISSVPTPKSTAVKYSDFRVVQCHGPNGAQMVVETDGSIWDHHDANWPQYRSLVLRVKGS